MTQQTELKKAGKKKSGTPSLREKALGYLARREHSYQELKRKLRAQVPAAEDDVAVDLDAHYEAVDALLEDFKKRGWLSEERFTEQVVHARQRKFGSMKIAHELREKGIDESRVEKAVAAIKDNDYANALAIYRKKYHAPPANRDEWAKQARFLQSRGFGFDVIKKVLSTQQENSGEEM
ncbi:MAG: recombination regulator RecX [Candidatus Methylopumilus sp.]|jgi:regulatory protein